MDATEQRMSWCIDRFINARRHLSQPATAAAAVTTTSGDTTTAAASGADSQQALPTSLSAVLHGDVRSQLWLPPPAQATVTSVSYAGQQTHLLSSTPSSAVSQCAWFCKLTWLDLAMSVPVEHRPQTSFLHPVLSWVAASVYPHLYLNSAVPISDSRSLEVFHGRRLLWPCGFYCKACFHCVFKQTIILQCQLICVCMYVCVTSLFRYIAAWFTISVSVLTAMFPGVLGLASTRMSPFWISLVLMKMDVLVTTGSECTKLQSNHHHQQTNTQILRAGCPSCCPTNIISTEGNTWCTCWMCQIMFAVLLSVMLTRPASSRPRTGPWRHTPRPRSMPKQNE